jgi:hypothetical protein
MSYKKINIEGNCIPIREFHLSNMAPNPTIVMIAKRGSGKSWVVRSLLSYFKSIPGGVIISPTDKMNNFYTDFFPELYVHYEYSSDLIQKLLLRQDRIIEKTKDKAKKGKKVDPRTVLVMDDCLAFNKTWTKDTPMREVFLNGRHFQMTFIFTMQDPMGIPPDLRVCSLLLNHLDKYILN